jgi:hypothetical protein
MTWLAIAAVAVLGAVAIAAADQNSPAKRRSPPPAKRFSIKQVRGKSTALLPGAKPSPLSLKLVNPNDARIFVTKVKVAVTSSPAQCPSGSNLRIVQSNASRSHPIRIRGGGSVRLPAGRISAPKIQLRERPVNQDGCKGRRFHLRFSGSAHG